MMHRRSVVAGMAAAGAMGWLPVQAQGLNLAQRRAIEAYRAQVLPGLLERISAAAGKELPVEVDWAAIAKPDLAERYLDADFWTDIYFVPLAEALEGVAADEMGRAALAEGLAGVRITWDPATAPITAYENGLAFEDGILAINFEPWVNAGDVAQRAAAIRRLLESRL